MNNVPARKARIFWTPNEDVAIEPVGNGIDHPHHRKTGGACWLFWQEATPEELYFRLLQQVCSLMINDGIPPNKVHEAFKVIPEYRLILPRDHPDSLSDEEADLLEEPFPNFGSGYPF